MFETATIHFQWVKTLTAACINIFKEAQRNKQKKKKNLTCKQHTQTDRHTNTDTHAHTSLLLTPTASLQWSRERWSLMWNINFQVSCSAWLRQVSAVTHLGQISSCKKLICHPAMHLSVLENGVMCAHIHTGACLRTHTHIDTSKQIVKPKTMN